MVASLNFCNVLRVEVVESLRSWSLEYEAAGEACNVVMWRIGAISHGNERVPIKTG